MPELQKAFRMLLLYHVNRDEAPAVGQSVDHSEKEMYAGACFTPTDERSLALHVCNADRAACTQQRTVTSVASSTVPGM